MRSHSDQTRKNKAFGAANREKNSSETVQKKEKQPGLSNDLKTGIENLSGHSTNKTPVAGTIQRKVNVKSPKSTLHLTERLGSGTFGTAYQTSDKKSVAKVSKTQTKKPVIVPSSFEGLKLDSMAGKENLPKKAPNDSALESEYNMMEEVSQKSENSFSSTPVFLGTVSIEKGKSPVNFDDELIDGQKAIVMEKVNVLDIHQQPHQREEHESLNTNVIIKDD